MKWGEATTDEMCIGFLAVVQKGQDLTRPGEKDQLRQFFHRQDEEREAYWREVGEKMKEAMKKKQAEAAAKGK